MRTHRGSGMLAAVVLGLALGSGTAQAALIWAGDALVDLDASGYSGATWVNNGTLGDFAAAGDPYLNPDVLGTGAAGVYFDGDGDWFIGPTAPASIESENPRSIEAWVLNPSVEVEESVVAWSHRGTWARNNSYGYGASPAFGAAGHWGDPNDMGWGTVPSANTWHHLAWTYDGTLMRVYVDGVETNSKDFGDPLLSWPGYSINIGAQASGDGTWVGEWPASMVISKVRIHDGTLSADDVLNNYADEVAQYPAVVISTPTPEPLTAGPVHRWSFSETGGAGTTLVDSIGMAHGVIVDQGPNDAFAGGGQVTLAGGLKDTSDYVDLPGGLISVLADATIEVWATPRSVWNWSRVFDFGKGTNEDYLMMSWTIGTDLNWDRVGIRVDNIEHLTDGAMAPYTLDQEAHIVMTIEEGASLGGETLITLYKDGQQAGILETSFRLSDIEDLENWIGRSMWPDDTANASYNEFRIYAYALTPDEILGNYQAGPDVVTPEPATLSLLVLGGMALWVRRRG